jgi:hypothetical protein
MARDRRECTGLYWKPRSTVNCRDSEQEGEDLTIVLQNCLMYLNHQIFSFLVFYCHNLPVSDNSTPPYTLITLLHQMLSRFRLTIRPALNGTVPLFLLCPGRLVVLVKMPFLSRFYKNFKICLKLVSHNL